MRESCYVIISITAWLCPCIMRNNINILHANVSYPNNSQSTGLILPITFRKNQCYVPIFKFQNNSITTTVNQGKFLCTMYYVYIKSLFIIILYFTLISISKGTFEFCIILFFRNSKHVNYCISDYALTMLYLNIFEHDVI